MCYRVTITFHVSVSVFDASALLSLAHQNFAQTLRLELFRFMEIDAFDCNQVGNDFNDIQLFRKQLINFI